MVNKSQIPFCGKDGREKYFVLSADLLIKGPCHISRLPYN